MGNLTIKELELMEEQLNLESILVKKYKLLASNVQDTNIRTKFEQVAARHQNHLDKLLTHLN